MSGLTLHRHGEASAPTMLLVHGLTDDGTCWPDAVAHWQADWHIVAVDQRGHGTSPRFAPDELPRAPDVLTDDLIEVLRSLPEPPVLIGHSLGGLVSARAAARAPELVRALVTEDPAKPSGHWQSNPQISAEQIRFVETATADPEAELARMRRETPWTETELLPWARAKAHVDRRYLREGLFLGDAAWESLFDALRVPTLIVVPEGGPMAPDPRLIGNPLVRYRVIAGAGHCVRRDRPDAFYRCVDDFLSGLDSRA